MRPRLSLAIGRAVPPLALVLGLTASMLPSGCGGGDARRDPPPPPPGGGGESQVVLPEPAARERLRAGVAMHVVPAETPIVTLRVVFDAGSASDEPGREGATMLAAQLMAEGGAGELSYAELTGRLYPMAGRIETHVGRDQTAFIGQVHRDHLEAFYELFRDVLLRPRLAEADFERIRAQMRTALTVDLRNARDEELGKEALHALLYAGHPYAHPPLGTAAGLERLRLDDVRAQRSRVLCAGRASVGLTGTLPEGFAAQVERDVRQLSAGACEGRAVLPAVAPIDGPHVLIVNKPAAESVAVSMGLPIAVRRDHPDYAALTLAAAWLGQHRQSIGRLMQAIRGERGLNYGDYAYVEHFTQEGGTRFPIANDARRQQYFSIWLRPLRPENAHFAIRLAVRELRRLARDGLREEDLQRVRTFADRYFALYLQTASRRLGFAMDDAFYGAEGEHLTRLRAAWSAMTLEQLNGAIRRHLDPDQLRIAIVASDAEALATAIVAETASPITYRSTVPESVLAEDREVVGYRLEIPRERIRIVRVEDMFAR